MHCEKFPCPCISGIYLLQYILSAGYQMTYRAYELMTSILFLPFSWFLGTCITFWRYLAVAESSSWFSVACGIPRYLPLSCKSALLKNQPKNYHLCWKKNNSKEGDTVTEKVHLPPHIWNNEKRTLNTLNDHNELRKLTSLHCTSSTY